MGNEPDGELNDPELDSEIHLLAELIVTASESEGPVDHRTVDIVLGVGDPTHASRGPEPDVRAEG